MGQIKKCLNCGNVSQPHDKFCSSCGGSRFSELQMQYPSSYSEYEARELTAKGKKIYLAACEGDAQAQVECGKMYYYGTEGARQSVRNAFDWFRSASRKDHAEAWFYMGEIVRCSTSTYFGSGYSAPALYEKSAKLGFAPAMWHIARYYMEGREIPKNEFLAARYYSEAARKGNSAALCTVAKFHLQGTHGFEHNVELAMSMYRKSGNLIIMYKDLFEAYSSGMGVPKNPAKAKEMDDALLNELLRLARTVPQKKGTICSYAMQVGDEYAKRGQVETAVAWYRQAHANGDVIATNRLQALKRL